MAPFVTLFSVIIEIHIPTTTNQTSGANQMSCANVHCQMSGQVSTYGGKNQKWRNAILLMSKQQMQA
ncbi:hypothetical protein KDA_67520 [Dictyobacter alpinus]|uniref:Uncharacterized protein n=1 Tax=Dictyobacter alpinus TaxID=2014873 RepID=A0A402BIP1_9CHLR|nr:hypothetical protein KDA_67520 [Dictyobacter alpinus]